MTENFYAEPEPSLCDSCVYGYHLEGGSVSVGHVASDQYKTFRQRYCPHPPPGQAGRPVGRAIHMSGYAECEYYNGVKAKECVGR